MGYYIQYFSTLFKGLGPSVFKIKWEARKLVKEVGKEDAMIYKKIVNLIREHKVTKALTDLKELKEKIKHSVHRAEALVFNIITVDRMAVKAEKDVLDALRELSKQAGKFGKKNIKILLDLEQSLAIAILQETKKGIKEEREEYKLVMQILNTAGKEHEDFMDQIRLAVQVISKQTKLARWAMRAEISAEKRDILLLKSTAQKIRNYVEKVKRETNSTKTQEQIIKELQGHYEHIINAVRDFYKESYLIKKRDLLLVLKILVNVNLLKQQLEKWKEQHFLPKEPADEIIKFVETEVEKKLEEGFRPIAQGFRILIHDTEEDYKEAQEIISRDIALAQRSTAQV